MAHIDWKHVSSQSTLEKGATEAVSMPLSDEEIQTIKASQANPFPPSDPLSTAYEPFDPREWRQTMVVIPGPVEFIMGSRFKGTIEDGAMPASHRYFGTPVTNWLLNFLYSANFSDIHCGMRGITQTQHKKRIGRTFALAAKPVTFEQYTQFDKSLELASLRWTVNLPVYSISWHMAAKYCNWLSREEGIAENQWCYEIEGDKITPKANYLSLVGYRLPTEAEMEYATRAGTVTARYYGETDELLPKALREVEWVKK